MTRIQMLIASAALVAAATPVVAQTPPLTLAEAEQSALHRQALDPLDHSHVDSNKYTTQSPRYNSSSTKPSSA